MKVNINAAAGVVVEIILKDGKKFTNADIKSIGFDPFFSTSTGMGEACHVTAVSAHGDELDRVILYAGGTNGKLISKKKAESSVVPLIDKKKAPAAAVVPAPVQPK